MTTLLGNICLALAIPVAGALIRTVLNYKPPHGGSGGADGYSIWILLVHFVLLLLLLPATFAVTRKGGLDWISSNAFLRYVAAFGGLLAAFVTLLMSASMLKDPQADPVWLRIFSQFAIVLVPVVLIAAGFVLLNDFLRISVPVNLYKWPLAFIALSGAVYIGAGIVEWGAHASDSHLASYQRYENAPSIRDTRLQEIEEADIDSEMVRMLELTGTMYPPEVQQKASAKVLSSATWQKQLIALLEEGDYALPVFNFLSRNEVTDKDKFAGPVRKGILAVAARLRHDIQATLPSDFYHDFFLDETERTLRAAEQFEGVGADYLPEMQALRAAYDEPIYGKKIRFDGMTLLDDWIAKKSGR